MSCRVCSHESRTEIDAAIDAGGDLFALAEQYRLTRAALAKHARCPRGSEPRRPRGKRRSDRPVVHRDSKPSKVATLPALERELEEDAPATSRSGEIISGRALLEPANKPTASSGSARERVELLVDSLQSLMSRLDATEGVALSTQLAVLRAMVGPLRLLGTFTGEIGASESTVASSPFYRRVRVAVVDALRPYPDASRAVIDALERVERGLDRPDLEAAAE